MDKAAGFYRKQQLDRIEDRRLVKVKFRDGSERETHWLHISLEQFDKVREILMEGQ